MSNRNNLRRLYFDVSIKKDTPDDVTKIIENFISCIAPYIDGFEGEYFGLMRYDQGEKLIYMGNNNTLEIEQR